MLTNSKLLPQIQRRSALSPLLAKRMTCLLCCLIGLPWAAAAEPDYRNPKEGVVFDTWFLVTFKGDKAGHLHSVAERVGSEIKSLNEMVFSLGRAGVEVKISMNSTNTETLDGKPAAFTSDLNASTMSMKSSGKIENGKIHIVNEQFGNTTERTVDYPAGALMPWGLYLLQMEKGLAPGTTYEAATYEPSLSHDEPQNMKVTVVGPEKIDLLGRQVDAIRVDSALIKGAMSVNTMSWVDEQGVPLKVSTNFMNLPIDFLRCDKAAALQERKAPEFFVATLVTPDATIDRRKANRVKYRLSVDGENANMPDWPKTGMQTPSAKTDKTVELDVARIDWKALKATEPTPSTPEAGAEFLEPSPFVNSADEAVKKMAKKAADGETDPLVLADKLRRFVSDNIEDKNLDVGFASASEVCRSMQGDCSEHGVLLAALGRACGIPSRLALGLVYVPTFRGNPDVFGFHMWTQFYVKGQWVDVDAAQNETDCNPTHLAVITDSLQHGALGDMAFSLLEIVGKLRIEVLEGEPKETIQRRN